MMTTAQQNVAPDPLPTSFVSHFGLRGRMNLVLCCLRGVMKGDISRSLKRRASKTLHEEFVNFWTRRLNNIANIWS